MKCLLCGKSYSNDLTFREFLLGVKMKKPCCDACFHQFKLIDKPGANRCRYCQKETEEYVCQDCLYWKEQGMVLEKHYVLYDYNEAMSDFMSQYKFQGNTLLADIFSQEIHQQLNKIDCDLIVPIPVSSKRLRQRGFHHIELLLETSQVPYQSLLRKRTHTKKQSSKTKEQRLKTKHAFHLRTKDYQELANKTIVLVDDVYTTGSTIMHAKRYLLEKNAKKVITFTLAR